MLQQVQLKMAFCRNLQKKVSNFGSIFWMNLVTVVSYFIHNYKKKKKKSSCSFFFIVDVQLQGLVGIIVFRDIDHAKAAPTVFKNGIRNFLKMK